MVSTSDDKKEYVIQGKSWDADLEPGADLEMNFLGRVTGDSPPRGSVFLEGQDPNATFPPNTGNTGQASQGPDVTVTLGPGGKCYSPASVKECLVNRILKTYLSEMYSL